MDIRVYGRNPKNKTYKYRSIRGIIDHYKTNFRVSAKNFLSDRHSEEVFESRSTEFKTEDKYKRYLIME